MADARALIVAVLWLVRRRPRQCWRSLLHGAVVVAARGAGRRAGRGTGHLGSAADPAHDPAGLPDPRARPVPGRGCCARRSGSTSSSRTPRPPRSTGRPATWSTSGPRAPRATSRSAPNATSTRSATSSCGIRCAPGSPPSWRPEVRLGGPDCAQPYDIALLNVSAMSFGALSGNAIEALNGGAARGGFAHDTGEGGDQPVSPQARRRPDLGDRLGILRLPRRRRPFRRRPVRGEGRAAVGEGHLDQAVPGRQTRPRRGAARRRRSARRSPPPAVCRRARRWCPRRRTPRSTPRWR